MIRVRKSSEAVKAVRDMRLKTGGKGAVVSAVLVLCVCLAVAVAGCSNSEELPHASDSSASAPVEAGGSEGQSAETGTSDEDTGSQGFSGFSEEYLNKEYDSYAEAYLDILKKNRSVITNKHPSDDLYRMGLNLGDGEIAVLDVFGDETPELLCIYLKSTNVDVDNILTYTKQDLCLKILTYSETTKKVESFFDDVVYSPVGGEHNYCVYMARGGELMMFLWSSDTASIGEFQPITPNQDMKYDENNLNGVDYNRAFVKLWYLDIGTEQIFKQYGEEISKDQFDKAIKDIMGNIDKVLFQGAVLGDLGLRLYKDVEFWSDIPPFEADNMTYDEAIAWLEAQIGSQ